MRKKRLVRAGFWIALAIAALPVVVMYVLPLILPDRSGYDLSLTLSAPQREYKLGDTIPILFTLKNNGKTTFPETAPWSEKIPFLRGRHEWEEPTFEFDLQARHKDGRPCVKVEYLAVERKIYSGNEIRVKPGKSRSHRTILNGYMLLREPGRYVVRGKLGPFESEPIEIVIKSRTAQQMAEHVGTLVQAYRNAGTNAAYSAARRLVYARDAGALPELIDLTYRRPTGMLMVAFEWYIPISSDAKAMVLRAATERGLTDPILIAMLRFGCSDSEFKQAIENSLSSKNSQIVKCALWAAMYFPNDSNTFVLAKLARSQDSSIRQYAIAALTLNRTEKGVKVLREALEDGDAAIRREAKESIISVYRGESVWDGYSLSGYSTSAHFLARGQDYYRGYWQKGRKARLDIAGDPNDSTWLGALNEVLHAMSDAEYEMVKGLAEGSLGVEDVADANDCVKVIGDILNDRDGDVRDVTLTRIRLMRRGKKGRALRPEDFPEMHKEAQKREDNLYPYR